MDYVLWSNAQHIEIKKGESGIFPRFIHPLHSCMDKWRDAEEERVNVPDVTYLPIKMFFNTDENIIWGLK
jgi:hypothetical protein